MLSLEGVSQAVSQLVSRVEPSIVSVESRRGCSASGVAWSQNWVVTSAHALEREDKLSVVLSGGQRVAAELLGAFPAGDLALLRVDAELTPLTPADPRQLALGELVLALGRSGARLRAKLGIVSSLAGPFRLGHGVRIEHFVESDIAPTAGLASGALVRVSGELIGVNSVRVARGALITLPASSVSQLVERLSVRGQLTRAELGVAVQTVRLPGPLAARLERSTGLIVMSVKSGSAAEQAGVMLGDVLLGLADAELASVEDLETALGEAAIGASLRLGLVRAGASLELSVEPHEKS
ncbi:MAG: trypsin-like peptidase domain-containing protein [Polyangiaceae bacterium]